MAYKIVLSNRFSNKLARMFAFFDASFSPELTKEFVERIDVKMKVVCHYPGIGSPSSKIPGVYRLNVSRKSKLYYCIKGRKVIMLDLLDTSRHEEDY